MNDEVKDYFYNKYNATNEKSDDCEIEDKSEIIMETFKEKFLGKREEK